MNVLQASSLLISKGSVTKSMYSSFDDIFRFKLLARSFKIFLWTASNASDCFFVILRGIQQSHIPEGFLFLCNKIPKEIHNLD